MNIPELGQSSSCCFVGLTHGCTVRGNSDISLLYLVTSLAATACTAFILLTNSAQKIVFSLSKVDILIFKVVRKNVSFGTILCLGPDCTYPNFANVRAIFCFCNLFAVRSKTC